jgi:hypothetical protein
MGPFSNATLAGSHILRATVLNRSGSNPGARATIGVLTFDGKNTGGVTGTLFNNEAGQSSTTTVLRGAATYSVDQRTGRIKFTGVGTDSMVGYIVHRGSGVTAFLVGIDGGAADGALEFQSHEGANFNSSAFTGAYSFGTDENVDYSTTNESRAASFDSSTSVVNGESDQSQPRTNGLLANQSYSNAFVFNAEGTRQKLSQLGIKENAKLRLIDPLGYLEFICLLSHARIVLTDSGGIQEETTALGIPCLTLRENTERPMTVTRGTNHIVGQDFEKIKAKAREILDGNSKKGERPELWDGHAAERIVEVLLK